LREQVHLLPWWERWESWWKDQLRYLKAERLEGELRLEPKAHCAFWQGRLPVAGRRWPLVIRWGPGTPFKAPAFYPEECFSSRHQLRDGSMCLLPPSRLTDGYEGVPDLGFWLDQAVKWFEGYVSEGWAMDVFQWMLTTPLRPGPGYRLNQLPKRIVGLPPEWSEGPPAPVGMFRALLPHASGSKEPAGMGVVTAWCHAQRLEWKSWAAARDLVDGESQEYLGVWVQPEPGALLSQGLFQDRRHDKSLRKFSERVLEWSEGRQETFLYGFCLPASWGESRYAWSFSEERRETLINAAQAQEVPSIETFLERAERDHIWPGVVLAPRALDQRRKLGRSEEAHQRISMTQVVLAGLGSLGSEVAHLLAQEGVKRFLLIDGDVMLPGNAARHRANVADSGRSKVEVVKRHIRRINPSADVVGMHGWLDELVHQLSAGPGPGGEENLCVAVGMTGDEGSEYVLGDLCASFRVPCLHGWLELQGQVLRLFRVLPGQDPRLLDMAREPASMPFLPRLAGDAPGPAECAETVLPGSASNLHAAANFMARIVLEVITGRTGRENHWLFAPGGIRDEALDVPQVLRAPYGMLSASVPVR
jgi:hypothetical protein